MDHRTGKVEIVGDTKKITINVVPK